MKFDGSDGGELHDQITDIGDMVPEDHDKLMEECAELISGSDSEEVFYGFDSE